MYSKLFKKVVRSLASARHLSAADQGVDDVLVLAPRKLSAPGQLSTVGLTPVKGRLFSVCQPVRRRLFADRQVDCSKQAAVGANRVRKASPTAAKKTYGWLDAPKKGMSLALPCKARVERSRRGKICITRTFARQLEHVLQKHLFLVRNRTVLSVSLDQLDQDKLDKLTQMNTDANKRFSSAKRKLIVSKALEKRLKVVLERHIVLAKCKAMSETPLHQLSSNDLGMLTKMNTFFNGKYSQKLRKVNKKPAGKR